MSIHEEITGLIGGTPLVKLSRINPVSQVEICVKIEGQNPGGSIKDRIALEMIRAAEESGELGPGGVIIEPTSGNTGIGLAMIGAARGYRVILVMPDSMSRERRKLLAALGAEVVLTPGAWGMSGAVERAQSLLNEIPGSFCPGQFDNPANPLAHEKTTGPEILTATGGHVDVFVAGVGTGGTITGVGRVLRRHIPGVKIVAVEPESSPVLQGGKPSSHGIQGIGAGFVPRVLDLDLIDEVISVSEEDAVRTELLLIKKEGILCGISSGANVYAALKLAEKLKPKSRIVTVLPDSGERYLSVLGKHLQGGTNDAQNPS